MKKLLFQTTLFLLLCSCIGKIEKAPVDYVNNRIGNISHLLVPTYPTTHLPNSMLRMIPTHNEFTTDRMEGLARIVLPIGEAIRCCCCLIEGILKISMGI